MSFKKKIIFYFYSYIKIDEKWNFSMSCCSHLSIYYKKSDLQRKLSSNSFLIRKKSIKPLTYKTEFFETLENKFT